MTGSSGDPLVDRAIDELRRLPQVDDLAVRRIVTAAAAARDASDTDGGPPQPRRLGERWLRPWLAIGLTAAAAAVGFMVRGAWSPTTDVEQVAAVPTTAAPAAPASEPSIQKIQMAASPAADAAPIPLQFVLRSGTARGVSVVGDFNGWNPASARMARSPDGDLWSITIPVAPGRHMYGFMIDDTVFTLDPRAPRTRDPDLGVEGSVVIVGRP